VEKANNTTTSTTKQQQKKQQQKTRPAKQQLRPRLRFCSIRENPRFNPRHPRAFFTDN
jgi:hypothetical protein